MNQRVIGITGPRGFIASHLARHLRQFDMPIVTADRETFADDAALDAFVQQCDTIIHLAAENRGDADQLYENNTSITDQLTAAIQRCDKPIHTIFASSTQRSNESPYGQSKKECEVALQRMCDSSRAAVTCLVIPNVYGAGCRPFYNSVVATFCHQLANGEQPEIHVDAEIRFIWINDLVERIVGCLEDHNTEGMRVVDVAATAQLSVSKLLNLLNRFREAFFDTGIVPDLSDPLDASLYTTFLYYIEPDKHRHEPQVFQDQRGQLFEIIKLANGGQVFFSTTKPGVIRGNHYHTRKVEWFCVLKGEASIRLRHVGQDKVHEYRVSGERPQFISIPVMHTHCIENVGDEELLTMFWCNEIFDPENADTVYENVA